MIERIELGLKRILESMYRTLRLIVGVALVVVAGACRESLPRAGCDLAAGLEGFDRFPRRFGRGAGVGSERAADQARADDACRSRLGLLVVLQARRAFAPGETITLDVGERRLGHARPGLVQPRQPHVEAHRAGQAARASGSSISSASMARRPGSPGARRSCRHDARALVDEAAAKCPHAKVFELCKTQEGRPVPALRIEQPGERRRRLGIWVQARQHAWESGSSWVCRGSSTGCSRTIRGPRHCGRRRGHRRADHGRRQRGDRRRRQEAEAARPQPRLERPAAHAGGDGGPGADPAS